MLLIIQDEDEDEEADEFDEEATRQSQNKEKVKFQGGRMWSNRWSALTATKKSMV